MSAAIFLDGTYEDDAYYAAVAAAVNVVAAADGGARFLRRIGVVPSLLVGDFDSLPAEDLSALAGAGAEVLRHPVRKDATDGELALDEVLRRGAGEVILAGALGALDHTWGHLVLLRRAAERGVPARLASPSLVVRVLVARETVTLDAHPGARVSLLPLAGDAVVTLERFEYGLTHETIPCDATLGLGNSVAPAAIVEGGATVVARGAAASGPSGAPGATVAVHEGVVAVLVFDGGETFGAHRRGARRGP